MLIFQKTLPQVDKLMHSNIQTISMFKKERYFFRLKYETFLKQTIEFKRQFTYVRWARKGFCESWRQINVIILDCTILPFFVLTSGSLFFLSTLIEIRPQIRNISTSVFSLVKVLTLLK